MKQARAYKIDLTKISGDGDFPCPRCGIKISPEAETEETYSILEAKVKNQILKEVVIRCNKCASHIYLTGFSFLQKISDSIKENLESKREGEAFCCVTHLRGFQLELK